MTEDRAGRSVARRQLDFATGKARISLAHLFPNEFDTLLWEIFREVDLHELRGFKPLSELLVRHPGSFVCGQRQNPAEFVTMKPFMQLRGSILTEFSIYKTHVVSVSRGALRYAAVYRRHESSEETTEWKVANSWGQSGYIHKVDEAILVLRRAGGLVEVTYSYEKVPHEDEMSIGFIEVKEIALNDFRTHFGDRYSYVAQNMIWELGSLVRTTANELRGKAEQYQASAVRIERMAEAIKE